jgi:diguanylate cyclase (GGDEF)-like protein
MQQGGEESAGSLAGDLDRLEAMLDGGDEPGLVRPRILALPEETRDRLACMACLGGSPTPALLAAACGIGVELLWQELAPALDDGLLVADGGGEGEAALLRFQGEPVRQAVYDSMEPGAPQAWHLQLARRLAPLAEYADAAVEQYLNAVAAIRDPQEAETACALFAAAAARSPGHAVTERYQAALTEVRAQAVGEPPAAEAAGGPVQERVDLLAVLHASQALSAQTTVAGLQEQLAETLTVMTGAGSVLLVVWDDAGQAWCLASPGEGMLPLSVLGAMDQAREPLVVDDAMLDESFAQDAYFAGAERCSLLAVPVLPVHGVGPARALIILEDRRDGGAFSPAQVELATLVAGQVAVSLDNAQLYASLERQLAERERQLAERGEALAAANRRLEFLSISDGLTGLANRRHFDDVLMREWLRAQRGGSFIGVVMVDVDYFKRYGDHYGHPGGDQCLRTVAAAIQAGVRCDVDTAARYGGEAFAVIVPGATMEAASVVAHRVHAAVLAMRTPHPASPFGIVTVSAGVAARVPSEAMTPEQFIKLADDALHRAKQLGRNRVAYAPAATQVAAASAM